jgi:glycosyltransferase involved in cell wall biosynthesis/SAM-dependent methyltransferase
MQTAAPTPLFSIIMNVFNGEPYLRAAIDSILAQTLTDWELIIWDDRSQDGSAAICTSYTDSRIRYILADEHVPVSIARERAIELAHAPWLAFLDQDDLWLPHKLSAQAEMIRADTGGTIGLIYGRTDQFDLNGRHRPFDRWHGSRQLPDGDIFARLLERPSFIALSSVVLRRDVVDALGPMPKHVRYCPDYYLCVEVARRTRAACLQELCCLYRVHATNMSRQFHGAIHAEAIEIISHAATPEQAVIVRRRRLVHRTWIGVDEIVTGKGWWRGVRHIATQGSVLYLAGRPMLLLGRKILNLLASKRWKYVTIRTLRDLGLLSVADRMKFQLACLTARSRNRAFVRSHPGFAVPPEDLAFDAFNHVDWQSYRDVGRQHAQLFADIIGREAHGGSLSILEWGCGPGRIIRHMGELLQDRALVLTGTDYNPRTIAWCRANLSGIEFTDNALLPPLPFADGTFDATFNFSVFTHLSADVQISWAHELWRVLKPGGLLVCTTHGDHYRYLLASTDEVARYDSGDVVIQAHYGEGRKWFFAIHPPAFVRQTLLRDFDDVRLVPLSAKSRMSQNVWVARKPAG